MIVPSGLGMDFMNQEDSYADRRRLFKSIWETAMNIDDKDPDIMKKPKVIKTLRLDEVDRCVIGKTKKQRIKNLRTVCNKILDFCDRQDADDVFYEHLANEAQQQREQNLHKVDLKTKKIKRMKKKIKKARSMFVPTTQANTKPNIRHISPAHSSKKNTVIGINNIRTMKPLPNTSNDEANISGMSGDNKKRRKIIRKKPVKRKRTQPSVVQSSPTGNITNRPLTHPDYSPISTVQKLTKIKEIDK